jgi:acetyl-CoA/propionyl-CoA carboxylase, biotin carboxylase, biotin carboxyl carrier protein
VQRRHQKLIEECPAFEIPPETRARMGDAAVSIAKACGYTNAGTIEMLYQDGEFYFLEMNTRLQVEHPVTELVFGLDLVEHQLRIASGEELSLRQQDVSPRGHAIELRINAERVAGGRFLPSPGRITDMRVPHGPGLRWDGGYEAGDEVSPNFDNLIAKLIAWAPDRNAAISRVRRALGELAIDGVATNAAAHRIVLDHDDFANGRHSTRWLESEITFDDSVGEYDLASTATGSAVDALGPSARTYSIGEHQYLVPDLLGSGRFTQRVPRRGAHGVDVSKIGRRTSRAVEGTGAISSPMQGTVVRVLVAVGEAVAADRVVCVVEAMKMENNLLAGVAGIVTSVLADAGQPVMAGELLLVIEPHDDQAKEPT